MRDYVREHLVGRTTYLAFCEKWLGPADGWPQHIRHRFVELERRVSEKMKSGDELWEWHAGDEPFAQRWDLAILRGGEIVDSWSEWMS